MRDSRIVVIIAGILIAVIGFGVLLAPIGIPPLLYPESQYIPAFDGYYYVSEIQNDNGNTSHSFFFHDVNFTFLYWHWLYFDVIGNITYFLAEQPVTVSVLVTFSDNTTEVLELEVDSPGSCLIGVSSELHGITSNYSHPKVGIATAETQELHSSWVYIVSVTR
ncbi:MAG: hypothetical protein ACFFEM_12575 [Candidatus Thorarchaeota archaeon]